MLIKISNELAVLLKDTQISDSVPINADKDIEALAEWIGIKQMIRSNLHDMQYPVRPKCNCKCTFCHPPNKS